MKDKPASARQVKQVASLSATMKDIMLVARVTKRNVAIYADAISPNVDNNGSGWNSDGAESETRSTSQELLS